MDRALLTRVGEALYGPRWQRELADALAVNERTMRRWLTGERHIPEHLSEDLLRLVQGRGEDLAKLAIELAGNRPAHDGREARDHEPRGSA